MEACVAAAMEAVTVCSGSGEAGGSEETGTLEAVSAANSVTTAAPNGHRAERPTMTSALCARFPGCSIAG